MGAVEVVEFVANIATTVAVVVVVVELFLHVKNAKDETARACRQNTLEKWQSDIGPTLIQLKRKLDKLTPPNGACGETLDVTLLGKHEVRGVVLDYLNEIEPFAAGVNLGVYDIEVLDRLYGENILRFYHSTKGFPERLAEEYGLEDLYVEYLGMVSKLEIVHSARHKGT